VFWSVETLGDRDCLVLKRDWLALPHHHHQVLLSILQQHLLALITVSCEHKVLDSHEDIGKKLVQSNELQSEVNAAQMIFGPA